MGFRALLSMDLFLPTPHFCIADCSIQVVMFVGKRALSMLVPGHALLSYVANGEISMDMIQRFSVTAG
ncbi:hypothetical protein NC651_027000 [Populus alba x Populus x berolinensis]|nr:hypothetical protein NC651_026995 [Populus alba x Populus x berolinensis]KAJ6886483.1 hypothetical protein NC651_027000 [Populus alba x Populus x berolinensis]